MAAPAGVRVYPSGGPIGERGHGPVKAGAAAPSRVPGWGPASRGASARQPRSRKFTAPLRVPIRA